MMSRSAGAQPELLNGAASGIQEADWPDRRGSMEWDVLKLDIADGVAHLRLTDGQRGNPIDARMARELREASAELRDNATVRSVLWTAEGPAFSYGGEVKGLLRELDSLPHLIRALLTDLNEAVLNMQLMDAPIVVALHGVCAGGMAAMVAGADFILASPRARMVAAYPGIGLSCDAGASVSYARRMGLSRARRFLLMNEALDADAALAAGLIDEVVQEDGVQARAHGLAGKLASGPTRAFGAIRRLLLGAADHPLATQLALEAEALANIAGSIDAREGLTAFSEKRKPVFRGC